MTALSLTPAGGAPVADQDVSVIICAYLDDRWDDLVRAVQSICRQTRPAQEIIVVVDHNPQLLQRLSTAMPALVVVANTEERGLSGARNTGIAHAHSPLLAFLDDVATFLSD